MKVQSTKSVNFGSIPLYRIDLRRAVDKTHFEKLPALVSLLDKSDSQRIHSTLKNTPNIFSQPRGIEILENYDLELQKTDGFLKNKFLAVECLQEPVEKQIKAAAIMSYYGDIASLDLLQSERAIKKDKALSGAGSAILFAVTDFAKKQGKDSVILDADRGAIPFYKGFGFKKPSIFSNKMVLTEDKFEKLEEVVQSKYSITPVNDIEIYAKDVEQDINYCTFFGQI